VEFKDKCKWLKEWNQIEKKGEKKEKEREIFVGTQTMERKKGKRSKRIRKTM